MKNLVFVPLELIEERYSLQWFGWFEKQIKDQNIDCITILPNKDPVKIEQGEFLDIIQTNKFKAQQLQEICTLFEEKKVTEDTVFLFMDAWFPGLEMLGYLRDTLKIKFKMVGLFHAGSWDDYDFLTQCGVRSWAKNSELSWFTLLDAMCVATQFHKELIVEKLNLPSSEQFEINKIKNKIHVTGFPIFDDFSSNELTPKLNKIVFPHRLAPEKQSELFDQLAWKFKTTTTDTLTASFSFIKTKEFNLTKQDYYRILNCSKISVSFAKQETFGIAMLESVLCGCIPLVPNRLSYKELYPEIFKYDEEVDAAVEVLNVMKRLRSYITNEMSYRCALVKLQQQILYSGMEAIPNMLKICEKV